MKRIARIGFLASAFLIALPLAATAGSETPAAKPAAKEEVKHCIDLGWLDQSEIVDDQTILFHMKGGKIYKNRLPYKCSGLKFEDGFAFATSLHQLCNTDIIKVLHQGNACGLGDFVPYHKPEKNKDGAKTPAPEMPKK